MRCGRKPLVVTSSVAVQSGSVIIAFVHSIPGWQQGASIGGDCRDRNEAATFPAVMVRGFAHLDLHARDYFQVFFDGLKPAHCFERQGRRSRLPFDSAIAPGLQLVLDKDTRFLDRGTHSCVFLALRRLRRLVRTKRHPPDLPAQPTRGSWISSEVGSIRPRRPPADGRAHRCR